MARHRSDRPIPRPLAGMLIVALPALLAAPAPAAQSPPEGSDPLQGFAETVSVEVVNVEVWVTDRQGRPVTGLTKDDFELFEDGERVEITNFAAYDEGTAAGAADGSGTASGTPEGPAEASLPTGTEGDPLHLAVLVDDWNLRPEDRSRVLDDLRGFLAEHVRPQDRVLVAVHDRALQLVQSFTSERRALTRSLDRVERGAPSGVALRNERRGALEAIREAWAAAVEGLPRLDTREPCVSAWGAMENAARSYAAAVEGHARRSAGAVASLARMLSGVPGRKVLLYVGNGMDQQAGAEMFHHMTELCPHRQSEAATYFSIHDLTWLYDEVAGRANAGRVTLYTLEGEAPVASEDIAVAGPQSRIYDPAEDSQGSGGGGAAAAPGAVGGGGGASYGQIFRPSAAVRRQAEMNREAPLVYMARETGGRAILDAADFQESFERIADDLGTHYSLGFSPDHGGDGRAHRLEVRVQGGQGYQVRHRRSYVDRPPEQRMVERIQAVAQFGNPEGPGASGVAVGAANPLHVRIETGEPAAGDSGFAVPLRVWVPLGALTLLPGDAGLQGRLRLMMAVSDARGNLGPVRQTVVPVEVKRLVESSAEGAGADVTQGEKLVEVQLRLDGDEHVVALGIRDEIGGEESYLRHEIRLAALPRAVSTEAMREE